MRFAGMAAWVCALSAWGADYDRDVRPLLEKHCYSCHGPAARMHGLRLDRKAAALKGGDSGAPAIVPGNASASLAFRYSAGLDPDIKMPPSGPRLTTEQVALLKAWIDAGASWPDEEASAERERGRNHWAFRPRTRPTVPVVRNPAWVRNPIDAFVLEKLEARGWQPAPPATSRQLMRRAHLDLTGLPPSLAEQESFAANPDLDARIDELLARPAYAERWARHWLDLVRYAETNGYERDGTKPNAWKYRDWVIGSLAADKPYDRFLIEQLAGDLLPDANAETRIATGYYRLGPWDDEPADPLEDRFDQLEDILASTSQVFLGLTLQCARCHNHKFEPLTARDYYSMVAIFNGLERPRNGRTELDLPVGTNEELAREAARDARIEPLRRDIAALREQQRRAHLLSGRSALPPAAVAALLASPEQRTLEQKTLASEYGGKLAKEITDPPAGVKDLEARIEAIRRERPDLPRGYFLHEPKEPPPTHLLVRGKASAPGPEVSPAVPAVLVEQQPDFPPRGRRLAFARWLADPAHPLTARVIVNRVWQHHFGEGLERTPSDFGVMGEKPTHPELLDWLANWFVDNGWSLKKLHRLILTSNAWRMSKQANDRYLAEDPENRLLWRAHYPRLEVEAIRDSILAVSGRLNPAMSGPSMLPDIPAAALEGSSDPGAVWKPSPEDEQSRRTVYAFLKRSMVVPMLEVLDLCDITRSTARRATTSVAPQALTLFNGDFVNRQARYFAWRLVNEAGSDRGRQIEHAWRLALARPPTAAERASMLTFLERETQAADPLRALEQLARVVFNLNEFVYVD